MDAIYDGVSILVGVFGLVATFFWYKPILRNVMASLALARSISAIVIALTVQPPLSTPVVLRLTAAGFVALLIFAIAMVEIPYLKAMSHARK